MAFSVGDLVDLYDGGFKQWRGEYIILKPPSETNGTLYKIRNTRTNSQQFVSPKALRRSRLGPFRIDSLHEKPL